MNKPLPTENDVSDKLKFLADTDLKYAKAKGYLENMRKAEKIVIARIHEDTKGTVDERMNAVYRHKD